RAARPRRSAGRGPLPHVGRLRGDERRNRPRQPGPHGAPRRPARGAVVVLRGDGTQPRLGGGALAGLPPAAGLGALRAAPGRSVRRGLSSHSVQAFPAAGRINRRGGAMLEGVAGIAMLTLMMVSAFMGWRIVRQAVPLGTPEKWVGFALLLVCA